MWATLWSRRDADDLALTDWTEKLRDIDDMLAVRGIPKKPSVAGRGAFGAVVAIATLWSTEYDGKPWGTTADYMAAVLAGIAAPVVVTAYEKVKQARA